jgi:ABC-type glutathione transport system ATPase component
MNSLNPVMRIEAQMLDVILVHSDYTKAEARERAAEALALVGLPREVLRAYPHELSGGMKQRAIIAIAMTLSLQLVIADEPTTALDVNVQRAVLESILEIKEKSHATVIFVSHDLAVHAELVDRLAIMYAGKIVEVETVHNLFRKPLHPYSQRLLSSIPVLGGARSAGGDSRSSAGSSGLAQRLPLPSALSLCYGEVQGDRAAADRGRNRALGCLSPLPESDECSAKPAEPEGESCQLLTCSTCNMSAPSSRHARARRNQS